MSLTELKSPIERPTFLIEQDGSYLSVDAIGPFWCEYPGPSMLFFQSYEAAKRSADRYRELMPATTCGGMKIVEFKTTPVNKS